MQISHINYIFYTIKQIYIKVFKGYINFLESPLF